ncbi:MAG: hypothetical protein K2M03_02805 [Muribaculaceae bacterium]|nr:hypothetical protein [Muribaculaceae bacterium]
MKKIILLFAVIISLMSSCGTNKRDADGNPIETEAQLDSARNAGREAARKIIVREWTDSMQFQNAILEARAAKSKYEMANRRQSVAAFDSAFISTIRTTRPDLARELQ